MKKIFSTITLCALFLAVGCQRTENLDLTQFSLEGKLVDGGGTKCTLRDLKTNESKGAFTNTGVSDAGGCLILGSFDGKVFARVSPSAVGGVPYQYNFPVYEIDTKTGLSKEICYLNSFIDPDSSHSPYERAFCVEQNHFYIQNFKTNDIEIEFSISQEFNAFGDFYLSPDGSMITLSAAKFKDDDFYEGALSTSILLGDTFSGKIQELYSSEDFITILAFQENRVYFKKGNQKCSINVEGEDLKCS